MIEEMIQKFKENRRKKAITNALGKYPCNDYLNNAINMLLDGNTDSGIREILYAIQKAHGDVFPYLRPELKARGLIREENGEIFICNH